MPNPYEDVIRNLIKGAQSVSPAASPARATGGSPYGSSQHAAARLKSPIANRNSPGPDGNPPANNWPAVQQALAIGALKSKAAEGLQTMSLNYTRPAIATAAGLGGMFNSQPRLGNVPVENPQNFRVVPPPALAGSPNARQSMGGYPNAVNINHNPPPVPGAAGLTGVDDPFKAPAPHKLPSQFTPVPRPEMDALDRNPAVATAAQERLKTIKHPSLQWKESGYWTRQNSDGDVWTEPMRSKNETRINMRSGPMPEEQWGFGMAIPRSQEAGGGYYPGPRGLLDKYVLGNRTIAESHVHDNQRGVSENDWAGVYGGLNDQGQRVPGTHIPGTILSSGNPVHYGPKLPGPPPKPLLRQYLGF